MSVVNEANSVRDFVRDRVASDDIHFIPGKELPRQENDVLLEAQAKEALVRMNPEIESNPSATCRCFFVPNVFSFATEGKDFRYGSVGMPVEMWVRGGRTRPMTAPRRRSGYHSGAS